MCRCVPLFLVVSRCFSLFSRRFVVVSRRFSLLSRCFIVFSSCFSLFYRCCIVVSRCFLVVSRSFLVGSRCFLVVSRCFIVVFLLFLDFWAPWKALGALSTSFWHVSGSGAVFGGAYPGLVALLGSIWGAFLDHFQPSEAIFDVKVRSQNCMRPKHEFADTAALWGLSMVDFHFFGAGRISTPLERNRCFLPKWLISIERCRVF